jgi:hypothetical protein
MRLGRVRVAMVIGVLAIALLVPATAMANGWILERGLIGFSIGQEWTRPVVSGHWAVYMTRPTAGLWSLRSYDLGSGRTTLLASDASFNVDEPAISGDWVAYQVGLDIHVKNILTGVVKNVTNDGLTTLEVAPSISGKYVVWSAYNGSNWDVWGKDFTSTHAKFLIAGGASNQGEPSIYGTRVAYTDAAAPGLGQIKVKTIGSTAGAKMITNNLLDQNSPSMGDHMVAWRARVSGIWVIRYYNYDTALTLDGPSDATYDMQNPQVAGDRILYDFSDGADKNMFVFDIRAHRSSGPFMFSFAMPNTDADEIWGSISGNTAVYLSNGYPYWAKLAVPSVSIGAVPLRVPHNGHIHLRGTLSDQGIPLSYTSLSVEKYSGGKWVKVKTITTSRTGTYSYTTPTLHSKTKYRVAYEGSIMLFNPGMAQHFSVVSAVRTGWPR